MSESKTALLKFLNTIKGSGSFAVSGVKKYEHPSLAVEGLGELTFPINAIQAKALIDVAEAAPFGQGSRTVTDREVRDGWQIDAALLTFQGKKWGKFLQKLVRETAVVLGLKDQKVTASLYKMLIYEEGGFFKTHKDSEKEPGMFGTLIVGLPSNYTGGTLRVAFQGQETTVSFAEASGQGKVPYAAFYADCDHELQPITSGYRVVLVYNLLQAAGKSEITRPDLRARLAELTDLLATRAPDISDKPLAVLLGHQYTAANFSASQLKLDDKPRAELLLRAAEQAGYLARLALVTHYQMGQLEGADHYYDYGRGSRGWSRNDEEPEPGEMGEIYEEYTSVEHWGESELPNLGETLLDEESIIANELGEGEPIAKEEEGYTGNAGMTMQYWYHYGAVVLWPKESHIQILEKTNLNIQLNWLRYYLKNWKKEDGLPTQTHVPALLKMLDPEKIESVRFETYDFSVIARALARPACKEIWDTEAQALLTAAFTGINPKSWVTLAGSVSPTALLPVFRKIASAGRPKVLDHYLSVLHAFLKTDEPELNTFALDQLSDLYQAFRLADVYKLKREAGDYYSEMSTLVKTAKSIVTRMLALSAWKEEETEWQYELLNVMMSPGPRKYVNKVLVGTLLSKKCPQVRLAEWLRQACIGDLEDRTASLPQPPADWQRAVPVTGSYRNEWEMLRPFLESPTKSFYDYKQVQARRSHLEQVVRFAKVDLRMETIRTGSPHTLRLIKTQKAYEMALKHYHQDQKLLGRLD